MRNYVLKDFVRSLPDFRPAVIFDVGANAGQSAQEFLQTYPDAEVFSFEPITKSFNALVEATKDFPSVRANHMALGSADGEVQMRSDGTSTTNRVIASRDPDNERIEVVKIETGDRFCEKNRIATIDFLKIDAEGHDLEVVIGFTQMLREHRIRLLQVECGLRPENVRHIPFEKFKYYLETLGYRLFGVYGLKRRRDDPAIAAWCDAVFASPRFSKSLLRSAQ